MSEGIRFGAHTDIGRVRQVNEDSKLAKPPLFAVADGMGGHNAGDVASNIAVEALAKKVLKEQGALTEGVRHANQAILAESEDHPELAGMGTTMTALYAEDHSVQIAHVGDSRAYLLRAGELIRLTVDHTHVERLVREGKIEREDADRHPKRNYLDRALGVERDVEVDVELKDALPGDRYMICSDGLHGLVDDEQIKLILEGEVDPQEASIGLCDAAVKAGGNDNVTAVIVDYPGDRPAPAPASRAVVETGARRRKARSRKKIAWLAGILVVLIAGGLIARTAVANSWYVGESGGKVTVFNGVAGAFAGIDLHSAEEVSELQVDALPPIYRPRLEAGIKANDYEDAVAIVRSLEKLAGTNAGAPAPDASETPTPSP